jgi:hypothetical protein
VAQQVMITPPPPAGPRLQDRVPLDAISTDARQAKPGRALLALIGAPLFAIGWLACKVFRVLFYAGAWCFSAVKVGYRQAAGKPLTQPTYEAVVAENEWLKAELQRQGISPS